MFDSCCKSRVQNDRLDFQVTNASMGGDPMRGASKTLRINYGWAGGAYDLAARENQRVSIPTQQQQSETGAPNGTQAGWPSDRFKTFQNSILYIDYPTTGRLTGRATPRPSHLRGGS